MTSESTAIAISPGRSAAYIDPRLRRPLDKPRNGLLEVALKREKCCLKLERDGQLEDSRFSSLVGHASPEHLVPSLSRLDRPSVT